MGIRSWFTRGSYLWIDSFLARYVCGTLAPISPRLSYSLWLNWTFWHSKKLKNFEIYYLYNCCTLSPGNNLFCSKYIFGTSTNSNNFRRAKSETTIAGILGTLLLLYGGYIRKTQEPIELGVFIGGLGRLFAHFLSGIIFFSEYAPPGTPAWIYSLIYNLFVVVPSTFVCLPFVLIIMQRLRENE